MVYHGIEDANNTILNFVNNTQKRIDACLDTDGPSIMIDIPSIKEVRINAKDRGAKFRYVTNINRENISYCKQLIKEFNAELRHLDEVKGNFEISDGGKEYIATASLQKAKPLKQLIYSNIKEIGEQQQYVFNTLWNKAIPAQEKIREIEEGIIPEITEIIRNTEEAQLLEWNILKKTKEEIQIIYSTVKAYKLQESLGIIDYLAKISNNDGIHVRILTPVDSSIEKSVKKLRDTTNIDIKYLEMETGIKNKYLISDRKISLVMELKDAEENIDDKYYHLLRQKKEDTEDSSTTTPIISTPQISAMVSTSIYSNSKSTVLSYISIFETLWKETELFQQLKQEDILKIEFVNLVAHELRTPLQSIIGYVEMIKTYPERTSRFLQPMERNTQRLHRLIEDILDITRIENGRLKLKKTTFDMNEKIVNVIRDLTPNRNVNDVNNNSRANHKVKFIFQPTKEPIMVFADKERIYQVVSNLIKNSLKFIPSVDGKIEITLEKVKNEDDTNKEGISVKIKDNGKGIDKEILPHLFEKFVTKSEKGTGLGLYISKNIIEAHNGKIWIETNNNTNNPDDTGAIFRFTLPLNNHYQK
ncbi:MAG TPA: HAMP domain-containing sensor histidine kinase [Nitrososphaeraceae archaeon]|nr:HAMP domain-containing sensor histidine kinase [Nitrososphaeraceae archaeon]